jgi:predicted acylesterase/phospholipase RssA
MHTNVKRFSELNIPVMMVATDLQRGEKVVCGRAIFSRPCGPP